LPLTARFSSKPLASPDKLKREEKKQKGEHLIWTLAGFGGYKDERVGRRSKGGRGEAPRRPTHMCSGPEIGESGDPEVTGASSPPAKKKKTKKKKKKEKKNKKKKRTKTKKTAGRVQQENLLGENTNESEKRIDNLRGRRRLAVSSSSQKSIVGRETSHPKIVIVKAKGQGARNGESR